MGKDTPCKHFKKAGVALLTRNGQQSRAPGSKGDTAERKVNSAGRCNILNACVPNNSGLNYKKKELPELKEE